MIGAMPMIQSKLANGPDLIFSRHPAERACEEISRGSKIAVIARARALIGALLIIVIPAKAGIQRQDIASYINMLRVWIPAFAGMTIGECLTQNRACDPVEHAPEHQIDFCTYSFVGITNFGATQFLSRPINPSSDCGAP